MFDEPHSPSRRAALGRLALAAGVLASTKLTQALASPTGHANSGPVAGRLKQSVCRWPYDKIPLPEFCRRAKHLGLAGIDLLQVDEWPVAQDAGLAVSLGYPSRRGKFIQTGFNDRANHALLISELETALPLAARAKVPNVIAMFGNRNAQIGEPAAIANCIAGLSKIAPLADELGVTICVELLNSKVDHKGYQGDRTLFGVEVVKAVNSPRVKLLYDAYHMQIMEGDLIRTIRTNKDYIAHVHTGGVPGRHELDETQEVNWRAVATALADLSFAGYMAHEFVPTRDPLTSLREAVALCDV